MPRVTYLDHYLGQLVQAGIINPEEAERVKKPQTINPEIEEEGSLND